MTSNYVVVEDRKTKCYTTLLRLHFVSIPRESNWIFSPEGEFTSSASKGI